MTHDDKEHDYPVSLDEKLVAHLLGEADAEVAAEVEAALAADPALRTRSEELQAALGLLRTPEFAPALDTARRQELRAAATGAAPDDASGATGGGTMHRFPMLRTAAALVIFGGLIAVWQKPWETDFAPQGDMAVLSEELGYVEDRNAETGSKSSADDAEGSISLVLAPNESSAPSTVKGPRASGRPELERRALTNPGPVGETSAGLALVMPPQSAAPSSPAPQDSLNSLGYLGGGGGGGGKNYGYEQPGAADEFLARDGRVGTESIFGRYSLESDLEEVEEQGPARRYLVDGYGWSYSEEDVLEHLRPHCGECREDAHRRKRCQHHESPRDMFFRFYGDNPVTRSSEEAISTFAADVDTASYPLTRNYLVNGSLPPKTAIRTEEFVNYFKLELAPPTEGDFAVHLDAMPSRFSADKSRMMLRAGVQARVVSREDRKPLNLVFVIDKSGSMAQQNRIELVKRSLELLVDQLRDDDTVGIITFDSDAHEVLASTPGHLRWEIREAVRGLGTGGSTNAGAGLELGFAMAEKAFRKDAVNRVILASDGVANTGETDQQAILDKVRSHAEAHIDLTTIGVGMGNHNDVFLEQLADNGDGSCHYVDDFEEAKRVLVDGFTGVMQVVARDVKIQVEFDGEVVEGWRQLGYENRSLTTEQFRDDSVDAGEVGAGHSVAALYELDLAQGAGGDAKLVTLRLRWFPDGSKEAVEEEHTLSLSQATSKWNLSEPRLRLSAVAAQYAEVLRRSYHAREDSYDLLKSESEALARELSDDASVIELRDMIARTESLARTQPLTDPLAQLVEESRIRRLQEAELARMEQDEATAKLLEEIRSQNDRIEAQISEILKAQ